MLTGKRTSLPPSRLESTHLPCETRSSCNTTIPPLLTTFACRNIAKDEQANIEIEQAFQVAVARKFRLFFSFDYAGLGDWDKAKVKNLINTYKGSPAYYIHENGKPLVSTFEGPGAAADWRDIKSATGCFFVPDWSSLVSFYLLLFLPRHSLTALC